MTEYDLAVYFWSSVVALSVVAPFVHVLASKVCDALEAHEHAPPASLTSSPIPSRP